MSSEITEENAQCGIPIESQNECSKTVQSILNNMDISDSNNPSCRETLHSEDTVQIENSLEAGLEIIEKDDIPVENENITQVADGDGCMNENLIARVRELDISQNKTVDVEPTKSQGTSSQDRMSVSLRNFLKLNSEISYKSGNEDDRNVKMKRIGFQGKGDDDDESVDSELDSQSESDDYDSDDDKTGLKEVQNMNIKKRKVQEESWLSVLGVDKLCAELPDISTLGLNNKEEFTHMGNLECVIDKIVTIAGLPDMPAYDLDTLLFLEEGQKVLGYVFDVMGPVSAPVYIVHMSSLEAIKNLQLQKGTKVYCAPKSTYTKYVFLQELMKMRGSDAAWLGEAEVPLEFQDFSDDEHESGSKVSKGDRKRQHSQERYRLFVKDMNRANERDTRLHRMADTHRLHMDRIAGVKSIGEQLRESRLRNQRSGSSNHPPEGRRGRSHLRNSSHGVGSSLSELENWAPNIGPLVVSSPSVSLLNFGDNSRLLVPSGFVSLVPPQNVSPRGVDSNRSTNRPNIRQNSMPGPSNDGWFN